MIEKSTFLNSAKVLSTRPFFTKEMHGRGDPPGLPMPGSEPQYWELLQEQDKATYLQLRREFTAGTVKRVRNHKLETFDGVLDAIRTFAERGDENDWRRFLVCGVCWMDNAIAINTRQLRLLVSKCKSSINGSLQKIGYTTNMSHTESWKILFPHIPMLKDHFSQLRQWTIRYKGPPPDPEMNTKRKSEFVIEKKRVKDLASAETREQRRPSYPLKFREKLGRFGDSAQ